MSELKVVFKDHCIVDWKKKEWVLVEVVKSQGLSELFIDGVKVTGKFLQEKT